VRTVAETEEGHTLQSSVSSVMAMDLTADVKLFPLTAAKCALVGRPCLHLSSEFSLFHASMRTSGEA
jgi:hypothetical protein